MTELTLEHPGQHLFIRSIGELGIRVAETWYSRALIVTPERLLDDWPPQSLPEIKTEHLRVVLELEPEVVLLGTGARQIFPKPEYLAAFHRRQLGVEVMSTQAACRTFNVLATDARKVVAALLPLGA
jgi:uncharacterized protein